MKNIISFFIKQQRLTLLLAFVWTAFIFFACFLPGKDLPKVKIFEIDKLVHIFLFGVVAVLWSLLALNGKSWTQVVLWVFFGSVALGTLVEIIQSSPWVHGRSGSFWDVLADTVGVLLGLVFIYFLKPKTVSNA